MKNALKQLADYDTVIQFEVFPLIEAIRKIHHEGTTSQNKWTVFVKTEQRGLNPKIKPGEAVDAYNQDEPRPTSSSIKG